MTEHSTAHEDLLRDLLSGDLDPGDPVARSLLAECSECRDQWESFGVIAANLDAVGRFERQVLLDAESITVAPELDDVDGILARVRRPTAGGASPRRRRLLGLAGGLAAAAALVFGVWIGGGFDSATHRPELPLGSRHIEVTEPIGPDGFRSFRWKPLEIPAGGFFKVTLYDSTSDGIVGDSGELTEPEWQPLPREHERWPNTIRWKVEAFDSVGGPLGESDLTLASRP